MKKFTRAVILLIIGVVLFGGLSSCALEDTYAYSDSDTYVCVYDGSNKNGHKLLEGYPLQPNEEGRKIDDDDRPIRIPASDRFWANLKDELKRDPGALPYFEEYAQGAAIPVQSEIKTEFKVNPDNPCDLYDNRLRRNVQDKEESENENALGYDARIGETYPDAAAVAATPWFIFLRENLEVAVQKAYKREVRKYPWQKVVFDYPINANEDGIVPEGEEPGESTQDVLARDVGREAQKLVTEKMGAEYLCGITSESECQPFTVTIVDATLPDEYQSLLAGRSEVEQLREDSKNADARLTALRDLDAKNQESKDLEERINAAELKAKQAEADLAIAQARIDKAACIVFAEYGLDCEGKFPPPNGGVDVNVTSPATPGG